MICECIVCGLKEDEAERIGESIDEHEAELICDSCFEEREKEGRTFGRHEEKGMTDEEWELGAMLHRARRHYGRDYKIIII